MIREWILVSGTARRRVMGDPWRGDSTPPGAKRRRGSVPASAQHDIGPWWVLPGFALLLLTGCATLDEGQCRTVDWFDLGQRDGADGYPPERIGDHHQACAEFGLQVDGDHWRRGYQAGLESYCTAENGYAVGRRGMHYGRVCPDGAESGFLAAYELGRETYDIEQEIAQLDRRIESLQERLSRSEGVDQEARRDTRRHLSELYRQMGWLRRSRDRLESEWRYRF